MCVCVYECGIILSVVYVFARVPVHKLIDMVHAEQAMCQPPSETDALPFALHFSFSVFNTQSLHRFELSVLKICMMCIL